MTSYEQPKLGEPYLLTDEEQGMSPYENLVDQGGLNDHEVLLLEEQDPAELKKLQQQLARCGLLGSVLSDLRRFESS